jgi:hypothetical protein
VKLVNGLHTKELMMGFFFIGFFFSFGTTFGMGMVLEVLACWIDGIAD